MLYGNSYLKKININDHLLIWHAFAVLLLTYLTLFKIILYRETSVKLHYLSNEFARVEVHVLKS